MELDLEQARRRAKERLRAARRGELVLREDREPRLADAQRSVANELGFPSWPALVAHVEATVGASDYGPVLRADVAPRDERFYETGPVLVRVRCRGGRCEIDARGWAVAAAGRPPGWRDAAERTVAEIGWNVARTGVVFVVAAADRDIGDLVRRTADAALAVRDAILALEE